MNNTNIKQHENIDNNDTEDNDSNKNNYNNNNNNDDDRNVSSSEQPPALLTSASVRVPLLIMENEVEDNIRNNRHKYDNMKKDGGDQCNDDNTNNNM